MAVNGKPNAVYHASDLVLLGNQSLQDTLRQKDILLALGLPKVDRMLTPLKRGDLLFVIGSTSHGKSSLLSWWARTRARKLERSGYGISRAVVYFSTESPVETIYKKWLANDLGMPMDKLVRGDITTVEWKGIDTWGIKFGNLPLWCIGKSIVKQQRDLRLTFDTLRSGLERVIRWHEEKGEKNIELDALFIDHLHDIAGQGGMDTVDWFSRAASGCKDVALDFAVPTVAAAQARREVGQNAEKGGDPIPQKSDGSQSKKIEEIADTIFGICRPALYCKPGQEFKWAKLSGGAPLIISEDDKAFVIKCTKQREGPVGWAVVIAWDPATNRFSEYEDMVEIRNLNRHLDAPPEEPPFNV